VPWYVGGSLGDKTLDKLVIVLDSSLGKPARGVQVAIQVKESGGQFSALASAETDNDGRCSSLLNQHEIGTGTYRIIFYVEEYFQKTGRESFYPQVEVSADLTTSRHYIPPSFFR
jgi:5-hydroxyisourate hydrolase